MKASVNERGPCGVGAGAGVGAGPDGDMAGSGSPHYSLRWNNHQTHILHAFDTLLQSEALVDVTLVCEDTRRVRAHKVVLSACSPFFEKIFAETPCKHPVIVLKDIRSWELQGIVDFMYKGEISVVEEQLSSLIKAAESLQVRGLSHHDQMPAQARGHADRHGDRHSDRDRHSGPMSGRQSPPQVCLEKFAHYPGAYHKDDAMSPHNGPGASSPYSPSPSDRDLRLSSPLRLPTIPHISFSDNPPTPSGDHFCSSPLPRRKQARPRRRSGEQSGDAQGRGALGLGPMGALPQDLSKTTSSPTSERPERPDRPDRLERLERMERLDMAENLSTKRSRPSSVGLPGERSGHSSRQTTPAPPTTPNAMPPSLKHESEESQSADCLDMSNPERRDFPNHVPDHPHPGLLGLRPDSSLDNPGFPTMPSLSALALTTPQHVFPLDSQLGLFPGMEACRNPLLNDLPESRNENHHLPNPNPNSGPVSGSGPTTSSKRSKSKWQDGRPKGQHSAPRGGPPRSWTNAELTEALQHVWNKKMTTSQASRIFGIPYNSLLMYVRGKYGKSLKLEQLRKDCQGGPMGPLELLGLPPLGHNNNQITTKEQHMERIDRMERDLDRDVPAMPESDLIMGPNFSPYSAGNFYPDFSSFPMPVSMVHLLPQSDKNRLNQAGAGQLPLALDFASFRGKEDLDRERERDRDREQDERDRESERDRKRERKAAQAHQVILRERERELQLQQREMLQQRRDQQDREILRERERDQRDRDQRDRDPPCSPRSSQSTPQPPAAPATPPSPSQCAQENNNTNTDKLMKTQDLLAFRACGVSSPKDDAIPVSAMTPVPTPPLAMLPAQPELVEFNGQE